ncbi:hypothetical protein AtNW77_Chr1g0072831 [Arabidopsis thaliana]|uniref:(thale cress) hypothetical protein n=1 Tax=Arabidopsis thaliana TaxID=3702 RepID=A0A7G2E859_ARATH|nr:unnamed protein product [Arabidopsis thaliana]
MFNCVAAAIAYGPGVFCGLVIGYIFSSHKQEWFAEKFGPKKKKSHSHPKCSLNPFLVVSMPL